MPYYTFKFNTDQKKAFLSYLKPDAVPRQLVTDPALHWNEKSGVLTVDYTPIDFRTNATQIRAAACGALGVSSKDVELKFGTEEAKTLAQSTPPTAAREHFRDFEATGKYPPQPLDPGLNPSMSSDAAVKQMLGTGPGFCLGGAHGDPDTIKGLIDSLDSGVGMLFIEEFSNVLQQDIEDFVSGKVAVMSPRLELRATTSKMDTVLIKAREKKAKVYGIDSAEGARTLPGSDGYEERAAKMNWAAEKTMAAAIKANPGVKFAALLGEAHCNTHFGGIPGIAQILGVPAVVVQGGKFTNLPEDTSLRRMPSPEEQVLLDQVMAKVPTASDTTGAVLAKLAMKEAAALKADGKLGDLEKAKAFANSPGWTKHASNLGYMADPTNAGADQRREAILDLIAKDDGAKLEQFLAVFPQDVNALCTNGNSEPILHRACLKGMPNAVKALLKAGADPAWVDAAGNNAVHYAVKERVEKVKANFRDGVSPVVTDDQLKDGQAAIVGDLLKAPGMSVNTQNKAGQTALHLAALNNNPAALKTLVIDHKANRAIQDNRGWTAETTAIGSTKPEAEKFLRNYDQLRRPMVPPPRGPFSTVELLCRATVCEDPADIPKMEARYKSLYANELFRPILDLAAADSLLPRDPPAKGGIRLFVANNDNVGKLYNSMKDQSPQGAYEETANVVHLSNRGTNDVEGTLIHELTHAAARMVYGDEVIPAAAGPEMAQYQKAFEEDAKMMALAPSTEKGLVTTLTGRMQTSYTSDKTVLQEALVGVPQLMAQYGEKYVADFAPNLSHYFKAFGAKCQDTVQNDPTYAASFAKLNNTALLPTLPPKRVEPVPALVRKEEIVTEDGKKEAAGDLTPSAIADKVVAFYKVGKGKPPAKDLAGRTVAFSHELYQLPDDEAKTLEKKRQVIVKILEKKLPADGLPPGVTTRRFKALVDDLTKAASGPTDQLVATITQRADTFIVAAKQDFEAHVQNSLGKVPPPSDADLAEYVVLRAEKVAFGATPAGGDPTGPLDLAKRKEMVTKLTGQLGALQVNAKTSPGNLDKLIGVVATGTDITAAKKKVGVPAAANSVRRAWTTALSKFR